MSLPLDSKRFPGTQSDTYSADRNSKPLVPDYERADLHQYDDFGNYIDVRRDAYNNEIPVDQPMHANTTAQAGAWGQRQFETLNGLTGINEIPYGQGAAFNTAEKVVVDNSRADRGKES